MEAIEQARRPGPRASSRRRTPPAFRVCEGLSEGLLYFQAVFAPWAFGATERWSVLTLNIAGYALGVLLVAKRWICLRWNHHPARWVEVEEAVWEREGAQAGGPTAEDSGKAEGE